MMPRRSTQSTVKLFVIAVGPAARIMYGCNEVLSILEQVHFLNN